MRERRKEEREEMPIGVEYAYVHDGRFQKLNCFAINVSKKGLSFFVPDPLEKGAHVQVRSDFYGRLLRKGSVRWVKHVMAQTWRVGIELE
jgi:hypothetical protein